MSYKDLANVKVGVTNTVHSRLRELKGKGDNFNDVIEKLLNDTYGAPSESIEFDVVDVISEGVLSGSL